MIIKDVKTVPLSIPYIDDPMPQWVEEWGVQLYVRLITDSGVGWGEVVVYGSGIIGAYSSIIDELISKVVIGSEIKDQTSIDSLREYLEKVLFTGGICGVVSGAIGGVEMALWDALAKSINKPLAELLGGIRRDSIPVYASFPRYRLINDVVRAVGRALERGFTFVKLHQSPKDVLDAVKAVREAYGYGVKVALDLNAPFDLVAALKFVNEVHKYEVEWVEEPLWPPNDYDALSRLVRKSPVPIAVGENEYTEYGFRRLIDSGVDIVQPDISKVGGVTRFRRIIELARSSGVKVAPHLRPQRSAVAMAFTLHVAAVYPEVFTVEYPLAQYPDDLFPNMPRVKGGVVELPRGSGIGLLVSEDAMAKYPFKQALRILRFSDLEAKG